MELRIWKRVVCTFLILIGIWSMSLVMKYEGRPVSAWSVLGEGRETIREDTVLEIYTIADYLNFAESVKAGNRYEGLYVNLYADLDFSDVTEGLVVGSEENTQCHFEGIFDGNGHHMKNLVIQSETEAGLFLNLKGTVCNLDIESGSIKGERCGAIASVLEIGGSILNCASRAEVQGDTEDGIVGVLRGKIRNCSGPYSDMTVEELNQGLCGFDSSLHVDDWYSWDMADGRPSLSGQTANTLVSINADYWINAERVTLLGYYSEWDAAWCFALPANARDVDLTVQLEFSDGEKRECYRESDCPLISCETDTGVFQIEFLTAVNVPSLFLDISKEKGLDYLNLDKENRLQGTFMLLNQDGMVCARGKMDRMKGHGNDSWQAPKKSYNLKFHEKEDLLGIGAGKNYVLLAAYRENSLLSYKLTNDLTKEIGMAYAPESRFVHLYVSGRYLGMYLLTGRIEIGNSRFQLKDLAKETQRMNRHALKDYERQAWYSDTSPAQRTWFELYGTPEDVTGGYIIELATMDYDREKSNFVSDRDFSFMLRSMPFASREQVDYIADYWQDFENALYSEDGYNNKGKYYAEYIDLESFADQWLFYELNQEHSLGDSVYFYKDSSETGDGLLHASWPWDMEKSLMSFGSASSSWLAGMPDKTHGYWVQLYSHEDFAEMVYKEWMEKFVPAMENALQKGVAESPEGVSSLDWYLEKYSEDGRMNHSRWLESDYEEKLERIRSIYTKRKDFLTKTLALYKSGYLSFYEEEQILYGVLASGENVPMKAETEPVVFSDDAK